jgi:hypothetical protein
VPQLVRPAIADDDVCVVVKDRSDQRRNRGTRVLAVGVGVHDHVCPQSERVVQPRGESTRQALVDRRTDDVFDAQAARNPCVSSLLPSSTTTMSMRSIPGIVNGRVASVSGRLSSSL